MTLNAGPPDDPPASQAAESEPLTGEALKAHVLERRQTILRTLGERRGTRVITLVHRKEPWEHGPGSITIEDSEKVLIAIRRTPEDLPIDLILHTPGGLALAAEMIAMALHHHAAEVSVMVPFYAMSGGTLIALAADAIYMDSYSVLGPVDPQISGFPAASILRIEAGKPRHLIDDQTLILMDVSRMALSSIQAFVMYLLKGRMTDDKRREAAEFLSSGYTTHDTPITLEKARELGLKVIEGIPEEVYELFETCEHGRCDRPCLGRYY